MPRLSDITGYRFGRLVAVSLSDSSSDGRPQWLCRCDCGAEKIARSNDLRNGKTKSCGCLQRDSGRANAPLAAAALVTHGMCGTRLERILKGMVQRCTNPNVIAFRDYGGRGIQICSEWLDDRGKFFKWAMSSGYEDNLTIDRIDNEKGYSPSNCRWVDRKAQANNTRKNRLLEYNGKSMTLSELASFAGVTTKTLWYRLNAGWDIERAVNTPTRAITK